MKISENTFKKYTSHEVKRFLPEYIEPSELDGIFVMTESADEVLKNIPVEYFWNGSAGMSYKNIMYFGITADGKVLESSQAHESGSNYAHSERYYEEASPLFEQWAGNDLKCIVRYYRNYYDWLGGKLEDDRRLELIILKKDKELLSNLKAKIEKAVKSCNNLAIALSVADHLGIDF